MLGCMRETFTAIIFHLLISPIFTGMDDPAVCCMCTLVDMHAFMPHLRYQAHSMVVLQLHECLAKSRTDKLCTIDEGTFP